jgi:hypothetical protein
MEEMVLLAFDQERVGKAMAAILFDFLEAIKVELPHETLKFAVPKEERNNFGFHSLLVKDVDHCF